MASASLHHTVLPVAGVAGVRHASVHATGDASYGRSARHWVVSVQTAVGSRHEGQGDKHSTPMWRYCLLPGAGAVLLAAKSRNKQRCQVRQAASVTLRATQDSIDGPESILRKKFPILQCRGPSSPLVQQSERNTELAGVQIVTQGDNGHRLFMIQEGCCHVTVNGHFVEMLGPGDIFGEWPLLTNTPQLSSVVTETEAVLYSIDYTHVRRELRRTRGADPFGYKARVKESIQDYAARYGLDLGHVQGHIAEELEQQPDLVQPRLAKLQKDVGRTPWHGITGTYILLSCFVAMVLMPFSPTSLPAWWVGSFLVASVWSAWSGLASHRRHWFKGLGTQSNFDSGIVSQFFLSYLIMRCSWDNMNMAIPEYMDGPWLHLLDVTVALATLIKMLNWDAVFDPDPRILLINFGQLIVPLWQLLFFLKPAWLLATLDENTSYNLLLAFIIQVGGNAGTYFAATLEVRGLISHEADVRLNLLFGLFVTLWPAVMAVTHGWPAFFDLFTLNGWLEYPFLSI